VSPRDVAGAVGRVVVDDDHLEAVARERLPLEASQQRRKRAGAVTDGHDHTQI
jgi:hypothetical protein